jgi:hypothetical protein
VSNPRLPPDLFQGVEKAQMAYIQVQKKKRNTMVRDKAAVTWVLSEIPQDINGKPFSKKAPLYCPFAKDKNFKPPQGYHHFQNAIFRRNALYPTRQEKRDADGIAYIEAINPQGQKRYFLPKPLGIIENNQLLTKGGKVFHLKQILPRRSDFVPLDSQTFGIPDKSAEVSAPQSMSTKTKKTTRFRHTPSLIPGMPDGIIPHRTPSLIPGVPDEMVESSSDSSALSSAEESYSAVEKSTEESGRDFASIGWYTAYTVKSPLGKK